MILLNQVVPVFTLPDGNRFLIRFAVMTNGFAKEAQCGSIVPFGHQQEVDGLAYSINYAVQIFPLVFDFDVGFVHAPPTPHCTLVSAKGLIQQRL
jgi:hypothetical protein